MSARSLREMCVSVEFGRFEKLSAVRLIEWGLLEDLGDRGDVTTSALIPSEQMATVRLVGRSPGILAGVPVIPQVFAALGAPVRYDIRIADGSPLERGTLVAELTGPLASLLIGERTILNIISHLSGIATLTRQYVDLIAGTKAAIYDTRKTLPGWRALAKYAVRAGGGKNHRLGLHDMVLIKDNHLAGWSATHAGRSLGEAVQQARDHSAGVPIEVEVDSLEQLSQVLTANPDMVLLDNMEPGLLRQAVALRDAHNPQIELEASGGINLNTVRAIAETGVERISVGALTHSAIALDLGFDWPG